MSSDETHAEKLRPFGIIDLSPSESFGLLHISASQYDSTIGSYPDAVLTYLDDDDGETITVGSGAELQHRLEEPVRAGSCRLSRPSLPSRRESLDRIHLFDIQHTANSQMIWLEHQAYSCKSLRGYFEADSHSGSGNSNASNKQVLFSKMPLSPADVTYPMLPAQQPPHLQPEAAVDINTATPFSPQPRLPSTCSAPQSVESDNQQVRDFLEKNVGTFADFLDSAAEVLRHVARKTREADASPIEIMLNGMKDVFSEVGQLGIEALNGLNYEPIPAKKDHEKKNETISQPDELAHTGKLSFARVHPELTLLESSPRDPIDIDETAQHECGEVFAETMGAAPGLGKRVSFADDSVDVLEEEATSSVSKPAKKTLADRVAAMSVAEVDRQSTTSYSDLLNKVQPGSSGGVKQVDLQSLLTSYSYLPKCAPTLHSAASKSQSSAYRSFPNRPGPAVPPTQKQTGPPPHSIMDLETSNPDFATRYPPLSLRRAKTVSDLHKSKQNGSESMNTKAALHRYPSIGQLESRRMPYDTHYNKCIKLPVETIEKEPQDDICSIRLLSPVSPIASDASAANKARRQGYKRPTVEDEPMDNEIKPEVACSRHAMTGSGRKSTARTLPGSWPEAKPEDTPAFAISSESSGAFFNRMTGIKEPEKLPRRSVSPALSCRNTSPPADPFWPSSSLRRAKTITASNPAARLTRPFDPLSSAPNPLFPRSKQHSAALQDFPQPKRSLTQRERSRPQYPSNDSTVGAPSLWSNFPRPAQVSLMQPPSYQGGLRQSQPTAWPSFPPTPQGPTFDQLLRSQAGPIPRPSMYPTGQSGMLAPLPTPASKVDDCVKTLQQMGYGMYDLNEAARLSMYASAAAGDVMEAVDMIEEDRKVAASMNLVNGSL